MKTTLFLILLVLTVVFANAQDVITDSKGQFLFGVPTTTIQPQLSSNNVGIVSPLLQFYRFRYYVEDETKNKIYTMAKSKVLFLKANVVNNSKSTLIFNKKTNYSPSLEVGLAWGFDSLMNPSAKAGFYRTYSISLFGEYQNFNYYDTLSKSFAPTKTNRISPGIKANLTLFRSTLYAISFSAAYQKSIITDNLTSYQNRANSFYFDNSVSTNGQVDGYIAPVRPIGNYRFSFSVPQFWVSGSWNDKLPFALTPYYFGVYADGIKPSNNLGLTLSFLGERFRKFDRTTNGDFDPKARYKFAQAFNIGYNLISTGSKEPRYLFVSGTFSLASFQGGRELPSRATK